MKVIIGTDGSASAQVAVELAAAIPWPAGSTLRVVAALDPASFYGPFGTFEPGMGDGEHNLEAALHDAASACAAQLARDGFSIDYRVLLGRTSGVLVEEARNLDADLIIIGSRGHGPIASMLLGSVSREVIDHAHCPVLVARGTRLRHVVLAHDGSETALAAERLVRDWPILWQLPVDVVNVTSGMPVWDFTPAVDVAFSPEQRAAMASEARQQDEKVAADAADRLAAGGRVAKAVVPSGSPAHQILTVAQEHGADLIVIGTRGNTGLKRLLLGSVARNVVAHATCSVLVVPPQT